MANKELVVYMKILSAHARRENFFMQYIELLRRNGLKWIVVPYPKIAVQLVLSAVRPKNLKIILERDLYLSHSTAKRTTKCLLRTLWTFPSPLESSTRALPSHQTLKARTNLSLLPERIKINRKGTAVQTVEIRFEPAETGIRAGESRFASFLLPQQKPSVTISVTVQLQRTRRRKSLEENSKKTERRRSSQ